MDSLTIIIKMLDVFVLLMKGAAFAMVVATARFFVKLLPSRLQRIVSALATIALFAALSRSSYLSVLAVSAISFGIWFVATFFKAKPLLFGALPQASGARRGSLSREVLGEGRRRDFGESCFAQYLSSYLRRTTVFLN